MRLIKAVLVGGSALFIIITLFSLLIPSRVMVSRGIVINQANVADIYRQVAYLENWKNWHPIFTIDSAKLIPGRSGAIDKDSIFHIRHRHQDILVSLQAADTTSIRFLIQVKGENDVENSILISPLGAQHSIQVEWRAVTRLHWYPWEKFYGIFIDQLSGPGYELALNGLKNFLERK